MTVPADELDRSSVISIHRLRSPDRTQSFNQIPERRLRYYRIVTGAR